MESRTTTRQIGALVGFFISGLIAAAALLAGLTKGSVELNPAAAFRSDDPIAQVFGIALLGMPAALFLGFLFGPIMARASQPMGVILVVVIAALAIPIGSATGTFTAMLAYAGGSGLTDPAGFASGMIPMVLAGGVLGTLLFGPTVYPVTLGVVAIAAAVLRRIERRRLLTSQ